MLCRNINISENLQNQILKMIDIPSFDVWWWEVDLSVESPWSEEGGVKHIWSVGASQDYNISSSVEACEERVHEL